MSGQVAKQGWVGRTGLTGPSVEQYRNTVPGARDVIWNPLYDYQTYPLAGNTNFTFFTTPKGQGVTSAPGAVGNKTLADTNMTGAGTLPAGNSFLCLGVEFDFYPNNTPGFRGDLAIAANLARNTDDVYLVGKGGVVTLTIQDRIYVQDSPLNKFPSQSALDGWAALADTTTAAAAGGVQIEYASWGGLAYNIVPVMIFQTQGFSLSLTFPVAIATSSAADGRICARLLGKLIRNAQ
jgi:hypothetical protein